MGSQEPVSPQTTPAQRVETQVCDVASQVVPVWQTTPAPPSEPATALWPHRQLPVFGSQTAAPGQVLFWHAVPLPDEHPASTPTKATTIQFKRRRETITVPSK